MKNIMFGDKKKKLTDTERSLISETVSIEGTINSSGAIDVAGLIKGPVSVSYTHLRAHET